MSAIFSILCDDYSPRESFRGEHGLSMLIQTPEINVLFDTGPGRAFLDNSVRMGLEIYGADAVVLSHGHGDHGNGIPRAMAACPRASLWLSEKALVDAHTLRDGRMIYAGLSPQAKRTIRAEAENGRVRWLPEIMDLGGGVKLFQAGPRENIPDDWRFYRADGEGREPDRFEDETALLIEGRDGCCLVVGCAHPGIENIVVKAEKISSRPVLSVVGGSHLVDASDDEVERRADFFESRGTLLHLGHCTGLDAFAILLRRLGKKVEPLHAGKQFELDF